MFGFVFLLMIILGLPVLVLYIEKRSKLVQWISAIIVCYLAGLAIGNIPDVSLNEQVLRTSTELSVAMAIPLLLFSANFIKWLKNSRPAYLSFLQGDHRGSAAAFGRFFLLGIIDQNAAHGLRSNGKKM